MLAGTNSVLPEKIIGAGCFSITFMQRVSLNSEPIPPEKDLDVCLAISLIKSLFSEKMFAHIPSDLFQLLDFVIDLYRPNAAILFSHAIFIFLLGFIYIYNLRSKK